MKQRKKRIFDIIQIGNDRDFVSRAFDIFIMVMILCNLFIAIFETFDLSARYMRILHLTELITVIVFTIEYLLRVWTSEYLYPEASGRHKALGRYVFSFGGLVDLLSFLPFYLPFFFPAGIVAFRMFRVIRILRLFRVNVYYDAFNVITNVLNKKKDQLLSSIFIILVLMVAASLCMYSLEHEAQPDVFKNAFSGFWWSVSTLLTVGYGDIYPITILGRFFGIIITFLGVGMVAIPTGILSAGFVEQYAHVKQMDEDTEKHKTHFMHLEITEKNPWAGKRIHDLVLPSNLRIVLVRRGERTIEPTETFRLNVGDRIVVESEKKYE